MPCSNWSQPYPITTPVGTPTQKPATPRIVSNTASDPCTGTAVVATDPYPGATRYEWYQATGALLATTTTPQAQLGIHPNGWILTIYVVAVTPGGKSPQSDQLVIRGAPIAPGKPGKPYQVNQGVIDASHAWVGITWDEPQCDGVDHYEIHHVTGEVLGTTGTRYFQLPIHPNGWQQTVYIVAVNGAGQASAPSDSTTFFGPPYP